MTTNIANSQMIEMLKGVFFPRRDPAMAWSRALSSMLLLPGVRGLWGLGSVDENGDVYDHSGQGRTLTNVSALQFGVYNKFIPYAIHDGAADYLTRPDEAGLDITGVLTFGCWVRSNAAPVATQTIIGKRNATGNQRAFRLIYDNTPALRVQVSSDGATTTEKISAVAYVSDTWVHLFARYTPSTELAIFVNGEKEVNTTSIPASLFNSSSAFRIGANGAGGEVLDGDTALGVLAAAAWDDSVIKTLYQTQRAIFSH